MTLNLVDGLALSSAPTGITARMVFIDSALDSLAPKSPEPLEEQPGYLLRLANMLQELIE